MLKKLTKLCGVSNVDLSRMQGDLSCISGDLSGISGDLTRVSGDLDECGITEADRKKVISIEELISEE